MHQQLTCQIQGKDIAFLQVKSRQLKLWLGVVKAALLFGILDRSIHLVTQIIEVPLNGPAADRAPFFGQRRTIGEFTLAQFEIDEK